MSFQPQGHALFSPRTIPDGLDASEFPRYLRMVYDDVGLAFSRQQANILDDPRLLDKRVAHSLQAMGQDISIIDRGKGSPGDTLMLVDPYNCVFASSTNPAPGGLFPSVTPHNILSATHTDTLPASLVLGDTLYVNATPVLTKLSGNTTATRKFLRQTGSGAVSAAPAWDTLVAGDIPALATAGGWTDDGTVVRLTTSTDQVGIGTASPAACLGIVNVNATSDVVLKVTGKASQTGPMVDILTSGGLHGYRMTLSTTLAKIRLADDATATMSAVLLMGAEGGGGANHAVLSWGDASNPISAPTCTADYLGCAGARIYTYKDATGQYDAGYGQDSLACWALCGDESITYDLWTGGVPGVITPFLRASWAGNGDLTNYGKIRSRKSTGAGTKGVPGIELEETGSGTDVIKLRAPSAVGADRTQLMQDLNATLVVVGDKAPTVGSRQLGKIDLTAQTADIASTNLTNSAPAGFYEIQAVLEDTTADITAGTVTVTFGWTDDVGATTDATLTQTLVATGRSRIAIPLYLASGAITYSVAHTGIFGSGAYALRIRVLSLG